MNDQDNAESAAPASERRPCAPLSLSSIPLNDMIRLLSGVGVDLLRQVTCHERLSLAAAVQSVPDGADILSRLDRFRFEERPDGPLTRGTRFLINGASYLATIERLVARHQTTGPAVESRRTRLQNQFARRAAGRGSVDDLSGFLNGFFSRQLAAGSGNAVPVSLWHTAGLAAWTDLDVCRRTTDLIHGVLRSRVCRSRQWDRTPHLHPNTFWLLIRLASPRGAVRSDTSRAPKRMLHVLRGLAARALHEPEWARFWDQWVLAEMLECSIWYVPQSVLLLPYVLEQEEARQPSSEVAADSADDSAAPGSEPAGTPASPLCDPKWNEDRPECLFVPWPPAVSDSEERPHNSFTRSLQRNLRNVSRKRAARSHAEKP